MPEAPKHCRLRRPSRRGSAAVAGYGKLSQRRDRAEGQCMATEGFFNGLLDPGRGVTGELSWPPPARHRAATRANHESTEEPA
jgi:hypothetical protein